MVLDTELILRAGDATRSMKLADFYLGYQHTALQPGEYLQRIRIPLPCGDVHVRSYKVSKRFDQDISAVCTAYCLRLEKGKVSEIRIACGGMAAIPARAFHCEEALQGAEWTESAIEQAMLALDEDFTPISDMRSSGDYRRQVCRNLLKRFYVETGQSTSTRVYSYGR
jgi:xanthine dehydrogenase small subunit